MKIIASIFFVIYLFFYPIAFAEKPKIVLVGDYWCPYNCAPGSDRPGFLVELITKALSLYDIEVEYRLLPWYQAVLAIENGSVDGIIGISSIEGKPLITTKIPLEYSENVAYTRAGVSWVYDGLNSLQGKKITFIMDYIIDEEINNFIGMNYTQNARLFDVQESESAVIESIANLISGDSDVYIEDKRVVEDYIKHNSVGQYIREAGMVSSKKLPIYIAFSNKIDKHKEYVSFFEQGISSLKATKEYDELKKKYDIK